MSRRKSKQPKPIDKKSPAYKAKVLKYQAKLKREAERASKAEARAKLEAVKAKRAAKALKATEKRIDQKEKAKEPKREARRTRKAKRAADRAQAKLDRLAVKAAKPKALAPVVIAVGSKDVLQDSPDDGAVDLNELTALVNKLTPKKAPLPLVGVKAPHPERRPSKPQLLQRGDYAAFRTPQRHTCLRVRIGMRLVDYIPMDSAGLEVRQLSHDRFAHEYPEQLAYPLLRAAEVFVRFGNSAGYTEDVQQHLEAILNSTDVGGTMFIPDAPASPDVAAAASAAPAPIKPAGKVSLANVNPKLITKENAMKKNAKAAKSTKSAGKKRVVFDASKLIAKNKGNPEALKKARKVKGAAGGNGSYAGKKITKLVKSAEAAGLREGSNRAKMLDFVLKQKSTDDVLGKGPKGIEIAGNNLRGMVERGHIKLT